MREMAAKKSKGSVASTRQQLHSGSVLLGVALGATAVIALTYLAKTGTLKTPLHSQEMAFQAAARTRMLAASRIPFRSAVPIPKPCACSTLVI